MGISTQGGPIIGGSSSGIALTACVSGSEIVAGRGGMREICWCLGLRAQGSRPGKGEGCRGNSRTPQMLQDHGLSTPLRTNALSAAAFMGMAGMARRPRLRNNGPEWICPLPFNAGITAAS